jgi:hypothetical protein
VGNSDAPLVVSGGAVGRFIGTNGVAGTLCGGSMRQQSKSVIMVMADLLQQC